MILKKNTNRELIFCISFQRTGTTSTGQFFRDHGFKVGDWNVSAKNDWGGIWFKGDFESIFNSKSFRKSQVFEDGPWFASDFFKYLFHHFPNSKFILIERNEDKWFDSMLSHSNGMSLGNTHRHAVLYYREDEFYKLRNFKESLWSDSIDNLLPINESHRKKYTTIYQNRNREIINFFEQFAPERLFKGKLEDQKLWHKMGAFFNMSVATNYSVHSNKSKKAI